MQTRSGSNAVLTPAPSSCPSGSRPHQPSGGCTDRWHGRRRAPGRLPSLGLAAGLFVARRRRVATSAGWPRTTGASGNENSGACDVSLDAPAPVDEQAARVSAAAASNVTRACRGSSIVLHRLAGPERDRRRDPVHRDLRAFVDCPDAASSAASNTRTRPGQPGIRIETTCSTGVPSRVMARARSFDSDRRSEPWACRSRASTVRPGTSG